MSELTWRRSWTASTRRCASSATGTTTRRPGRKVTHDTWGAADARMSAAAVGPATSAPPWTTSGYSKPSEPSKAPQAKPPTDPPHPGTQHKPPGGPPAARDPACGLDDPG